MGPKSSHSRKGKKAWRKNIDTTDVERIIEETAVEEVQAPKPETLTDDQLFFIDTNADEGLEPNSQQRKRRLADKKLKSQVVLEAGRAVKPLWAPPKRRPVGALKPTKGSAAAEAADAAAAAAAAAGGSKRKQQQQQRRRKPGDEPVADIWGDGPAAAPAQAAAAEWDGTVPGAQLLKAGGVGQQQERRRQQARRPVARKLRPIAAVEVDMEGCSYNPDKEAHQEALAAVVAAEVKKEINQQLAPKAPPALAPEGYRRPLDPVLALLGEGVEAVSEQEEEGDEEQQQQDQQQRQAGGKRKRGGGDEDPNAINLEEEVEGEKEGEEENDGEEGQEQQQQQQQQGGGSRPGGAPAHKKTAVDRNREARRRAQEAAAAAAAALKRQRRDLQNIAQLRGALEEEEAGREARRVRRETVRAEKERSEPPRLGRLKYIEAPPPVLTSDEVTGSLRQLAPYPMVATDRYRALQKRGLIEVRRPAGDKKKGKRVEYVQGVRKEKAEERQAEVDVLKRARVKAGRRAKAAEQRAARQQGGGARQVADGELAAATMGW